jgi:hypothetical protein
MEQTDLVRRRERIRYLRPPVEQLWQLDQAALDPRPQGFALDILHDYEVLSFALFNRVDGDDVLVVERGCRSGLALESLDGLAVVGYVVRQEF